MTIALVDQGLNMMLTRHRLSSFLFCFIYSFKLLETHGQMIRDAQIRLHAKMFKLHIFMYNLRILSHLGLIFSV